MPTKRAVLVCVLGVLSVLCSPGLGAPEDDQVAAYLRSHEMLPLLEVQLEDRLSNAKDGQMRRALGEELATLYLDEIKAYTPDDPYREILFNRASAFVIRFDSIPMYRLRIELNIEAYLAIEPKVELARLDLLEPAQRDGVIERLSRLNHRFSVLISTLDPAVTKLERSRARSKNPNGADIQEMLRDLRRDRSLAHYYHAWSGYSLAVLQDRHVATDAFVSFGWLLGAQGDMPRLSVFNETTLEFEHVARAAIGLALSYAQSGDALTGRSWAKFVAESSYTDPESKQAAEDRFLQIVAMDRDWTAALRYALYLEKERGGDAAMRVADARFLALQSLSAMRSSRVGRGGMGEAKKVAQYAIEQLVNQGEIGHVLDLYRRFDSLPLLAESFITRYAQALGELNRIEQTDNSGMYASVATLFAQALEASDADRFPRERDDCALKLAFAEIRSGRASDAVKACEQVIKRSTIEGVIEEARWVRIAAFDSINIKAGRASSDALDQAVREYIIAYPSTPRSAKLILRHAMRGTIDPQIALDTLGAIGDDDPIVIPARRALVGLRYKQLRATGFSDQGEQAQVLTMIGWIVEHAPTEIVDLNDARQRLSTIRIGLNLALRGDSADTAFAHRLIERGMGLLAFDASLGVYRPELIYRQIQLSVLDHRLSDAMDLFNTLEVLDSSKADNARILLFNDSIRLWQEHQSAPVARRLVDLGSKILAKQTPPYPNPLGAQGSSIAETIAQAGVYLWRSDGDEDARDLALRVSLMVLDRGQPSEPGLRRTVGLAKDSGDRTHELDGWLRLFSAYPPDDERWYEARYESLRLMRALDPVRAKASYDQYRVLHPDLGPAPWNTKIATLFGDPVPGAHPSPIGDSP